MKIFNMKKTLHALFLMAICLTQQVTAQNALGCDGRRYFLDLFPNFTQTTVEYGRNMTWLGTVDPLYMDVFQPQGDTLSKRPTIVLAFGGGFVGGTRETMHDLAKTFVKKGYVTVAIDYRLYSIGILGFPDSAKMIPAILQAMQDMKASVRFLRKDAATTNTFRIDPNNIIAGGVSAGAITALLVGMLDSTDAIPANMRAAIATQGGFEGNSGNPGYRSDVKGVLNMSGALSLRSWLDAGDPPFVSFHGTADDVVPYGYAPNVYRFYGFGSGELHAQALQVGIPSVLVTVQGGGHGDIYLPTGPYAAQAAVFYNKATTFLQRLVCGTTPLETNELHIGSVQNVHPNPAVGNQLTFDFTLKSTIADLNFEIVNHLGQLVQKTNGGTFGEGENHYTLNLNDLPKGIYFARPIAAQGTLGTFKFLVP
jgi:acetyl esterase/lipase